MISNVIGHNTIHIPWNIWGVHSFLSLTVIIIIVMIQFSAWVTYFIWGHSQVTYWEMDPSKLEQPAETWGPFLESPGNYRARKTVFRLLC